MALAEVKAGQAGGIVVAKIDRLGRSSADVLGLVERAQREGWRLVALDVGLDTTTPAGELVAAALASGGAVRVATNLGAAAGEARDPPPARPPARTRDGAA